MAPGDFRLSMRVDTPHLVARHLQIKDYWWPSDSSLIAGQITPYGYVVVVPQWVGRPDGFTTAELMSAARYTGVVLEPQWQDGVLTIHGAGLDWLLGVPSTGIGPHHSGASFIGDTLSYVVSFLAGIGTGLVAGTVPASGSYTAVHEYQLVREALGVVMDTMGAHYRIRPSGHIDAEFLGVGSVFVETPTVVASSYNPGSDAIWTGLRADTLRSRQSVRDHLTQVYVGDTYVAGITNWQPGGLHGTGGQIERVKLFPDGGATDVAALADAIVGRHGIAASYEMTLDQWQIVGVSGTNDTIHPGDVISVHDPGSSFWAPDVPPVWFRGDCIAPLPVRVTEVEWPFVDGMGVYYRPVGSGHGTIGTGDWIDLTPYVEWESTTANASTLVRIDRAEQWVY